MRRSCVKPHCEQLAVATVALRYDLREVLIRDLLEERDPNLLDLCRNHAEKLTPPVGWTVHDDRVSAEPPIESGAMVLPDAPAIFSD